MINVECYGNRVVVFFNKEDFFAFNHIIVLFFPTNGDVGKNVEINCIYGMCNMGSYGIKKARV